MQDLLTLNSRFALVDQLIFRTEGDGLIVADIANAHSTASICLQGGHVMTWQPKSVNEPVVWLSPLAKLAPGKSIRGGVPICWPWFGPHETEAGFPGHGFARTVPWAVTDSAKLPGGATRLTLELQESDQTRAQWNKPSRAAVTVTVGETLKVELTTTNLGDEPFVIGEALHTYLQIGDIAETRVLGLEGSDYWDKVGGLARRTQDGPVSFSGEVDRVYINTAADCVIEDPVLKRRLRVAKTGSQSTVVWTPWAEKAAKMGDFGDLNGVKGAGWRGMVCVESGNALDNVVTVPAHGSHTLAVEYSVENL
jgi:D-hexose-6-phosphate mutarotase